MQLEQKPQKMYDYSLVQEQVGEGWGEKRESENRQGGRGGGRVRWRREGRARDTQKNTCWD